MIRTTLSIAAFSFAVVACGPATSEKSNEEEYIEEIIVTEEEWISLFDGDNLTGWTSFGKDEPGEAWEAADGVLYFNSGKKEEGASGGDLVTKGTY